MNHRCGGSCERTLRLHHGQSSKRDALYGGHQQSAKRIYEHREGLVSGFSKSYGCKLLVWFEVHETMESAIAREKQLKAGSRTKKLALIEAVNPNWKDLYGSLFE